MTKRSKLPRGHKGTFDAFKRKEIRKQVGTVPAKQTYSEFFAEQSKAFQDDVLGPTRAKLFRDGNLKLSKFVNRNGDELTLAQLVRRDRQAFIDAGLDPKNFL